MIIVKSKNYFPPNWYAYASKLATEYKVKYQNDGRKHGKRHCAVWQIGAVSVIVHHTKNGNIIAEIF